VSEPASALADALVALSEAGVAFVIVGVGGINFYARIPAEAYATLDLDALLEPTTANLREALRVLSGLGYTFESGSEPFVDLEDETILAGVVRNGACLSALRQDAVQVDLMLSASGFSYDQLAADSVSFQIAGSPVRVGTLAKLLESKYASGRPKDLQFLRAFEASASEDESDS